MVKRIRAAVVGWPMVRLVAGWTEGCKDDGVVVFVLRVQSFVVGLRVPCRIGTLL